MKTFLTSIYLYACVIPSVKYKELLILQTSNWHNINPILTTIGEVTRTCKHHHKRWLIHFVRIYLSCQGEQILRAFIDKFITT